MKAGARATKRVLYLQYTNPGGYPPLHHSARILSEHGWDCLFLGTGAFGTDLLVVPVGITRRLRYRGAGLFQKLHYVYFVGWCLYWYARWRPHLIYASDPLSTPVAVLLKALGATVLYHEHDPPIDSTGKFSANKIVQLSRQRLLNNADAVVFPHQVRAEQAQATSSPRCFIVWNCASLQDVQDRKGRSGESLRLWYHGSLTEARVPHTILYAIQETEGIDLEIKGYETIGSKGFSHSYLALARKLGLDDRVSIQGPISRASLLNRASLAHVGISLFMGESADPLIASMAGASNKSFDYLACGLPVLVPDTPEWREMFVEPGYGLAVDPSSIAELARTFAWMRDNRNLLVEMGERGRLRIQDEWNYEHQFRPVHAWIEGAIESA